MVFIDQAQLRKIEITQISLELYNAFYTLILFFIFAFNICTLLCLTIATRKYSINRVTKSKTNAEFNLHLWLYLINRQIPQQL